MTSSTPKRMPRPRLTLDCAIKPYERNVKEEQPAAKEPYERSVREEQPTVKIEITDSGSNSATTGHDAQQKLEYIALGRDEDEALLQKLLKSDHMRPDERNGRFQPGRTFLSFAASRASAAIVKIFLASDKVNPDSRDAKGRTPLSYAAEEKREAIVKLLLENNKVDPDSRDNEGRTPLSYAVGGKYNAIATDREAVVTMLLDSDRVDPDSQDNKGRTPLSYAVCTTKNPIFGPLVWSSSVGPDSRDGNGRKSPLYAVGMSGNTIVKKLLSSNRVDPDSRDDKGRTPLSYAVGVGSNATVRMLLDCETVDPDSRDKSGRTPLSWAAQNGPRDVTIPLSLLETGKVNPASQDEQGYTALWWAIRGRCEELVALLLGTGQVDVEARERSSGRTLLSHAARVGNESIVKALLGNSNVNLNSTDNREITPLMWAVEYGNLRVVDLLLGDGRLHEGRKEHNSLEIDARYLTHWENSCSQQHGEGCVPSSVKDRLPHQVPDWVIDTAEGCLVPGRTVSRYIALSYVWVATDASTDAPMTERLMLTQENLARSQERGYLQGDVVARLPHTVKDAILLVQKYGERYLWVDCLCIVQDSERTRDQVDNMGEIYAGAYLTIVAATTSGRLNSLSIREHSYGVRSTTEQLYDKLFDTRWATRGWTFQEQMLSNRVIIFIDGDVFWDCQRCVWNRDDLTPESTTSTSFTRPYYDTARQISSMSQPDLDMYIEMISLYNSRDLTFPQDALPAISGVLSKLEHSFISGFVSGLPCTFLDLALLWQPYSIASRRVAKPGGTIAPRRSLPSWSWCGWRCPVDPHNLRSRFDYLDEDHVGENTTNPIPSTWQTHKLVQWYALSEDMQHTSRIDESDSPFTRGVAILSRNAVPTDTPPFDHQNECGSSREGKHTGSVDTNVKSTSQPSSVSSARSELQLRKNWPFLSCKTSSASLRIKTILKRGNPLRKQYSLKLRSVFELRKFAREPDYSEMCSLIHMEDKEGRQAGVLRHMNRDRAEPGDVIELIALSTGTIRSESLRNVGGNSGPLFKQAMKSDTDDTWSSEYLELRSEVEEYGVQSISGWEYHFYNVLWIERKGEIVYRKAAGRVPKVVWETNCTEPAKVILG